VLRRDKSVVRTYRPNKITYGASILKATFESEKWPPILARRSTVYLCVVTNGVPGKLWLFKRIPFCRYKSIIRSTYTVHENNYNILAQAPETQYVEFV